MFWLYITIFSYLLFALANLGDKLMVSKYQTKPVVYAFYVGFLGIVGLVLIPFGVINPGASQIIWSLLAGLAFVGALYFMYQALHIGETTRAITILGGTSPIFTFIFSLFFIPENLRLTELVAFFVLIMAIVILSWPPKDHISKKIQHQQTKFALIAGIFYAANYVLSKFVYAHQPFVSGFFWIRIGCVITALLILLWPRNRKAISLDLRKPKKQKKAGLLLGVQILGGLGVIGQNIALSLTSASLVNALQAIQYAFIFVLTALLGKKIPVLLEKLHPKEIIRKIIAIILISIGLYLITIS
ncbi:MAG: EamA family transporter [Patescibacteria group bacterium]|nr:EamA family transporter [Patescibacteria group bacterium]